MTKEEVIDIINEQLNKPKNMYIQRLDKSIPMPVYATECDAGMDLRASKDVFIKPGENKIIPTGLKVVIPQGYELQIRARSGISSKTPLRLSNGVGTIDSGFRGEMGIIVTNISTKGEENIFTLNEKNNSEGTYLIKKGDRIAQMVLCKYEKLKLKETDDVNEFNSDRGSGFGSSGIQ